VALSAKSSLGLDNSLKQLPGNTELTTGEPDTSALENDGDMRTLCNEVDRRNVLIRSIREDFARLRVKELDIPYTFPDRHLDTESWVLVVVGLAVFTLGKLENRSPEHVDVVLGHGRLSEPFLLVCKSICLDFLLKLFDICAELGNCGSIVFLSGELERHVVRLIARFLVLECGDTPRHHERRGNIGCAVGSAIENSDTLATGGVNLGLGVFDIFIGIEGLTRNNLLGSFGCGG